MKPAKSIFETPPRGGFPTLADALLWTLCQNKSNDWFLPENKASDFLQSLVQKQIASLFNQASGRDLIGNGSTLVRFCTKFAKNKKDACLSRSWWNDTVFPLLGSRLENLVGDCTGGKVNILVLQTDITTRSEEFIVCPTNTKLLPTGGVGGAILKAGGAELLSQCLSAPSVDGRPRGEKCHVGDSRVTSAGGSLKCKWVIHVVGPNCKNGITNKERELLKACYEAVFVRTATSIAIPSISTGKNAFPATEAARIAAETAVKHSTEFPKTKIVFCIPDEKTANIFRAALRAETRK